MTEEPTDIFDELSRSHIAIIGTNLGMERSFVDRLQISGKALEAAIPTVRTGALQEVVVEAEVLQRYE